jgi:hypothetical protein
MKTDNLKTPTAGQAQRALLECEEHFNKLLTESAQGLKALERGIITQGEFIHLEHEKLSEFEMQAGRIIAALLMNPTSFEN